MRALGVAMTLALVALAPAGASQSSPSQPELVISDPEGDVGLRQSPGSLPGAPLSQTLDILGLRVHGEDPEAILIELQVKQLRDASDPSLSGPRQYTIFFGLEAPSLTYRANFRQMGTVPNATPSFTTDLCVMTRNAGYCTYQRVGGSVDYTRSTLQWHIPKLSLMGRNDVGTNYGGQNLPDVVLQPGQKLIGFRGESSGQYFLADRVPNTGTGGPYTLQYGAANDRLRLSLAKQNQTDDGPPSPTQPRDNAAYPLVAVDAGQATAVAVDVTNLNGGKRLVNLTASLADPRANPRWSLRLVPSISVPGNESRTVNLIVTALGDVEHREEAIVRLQARSIGVGNEIGALTLRLVASVPPSPVKNTLYLHAAPPSNQGFASTCSLGYGMPFYCQPRFWMNTLKEDALATGDKAGASSASSGWNPNGWSYFYTFRLDAPLSRDLTLDPLTPVVATLKIQSAPPDGSVRVRLSAGDVFVGEASRPLATQGSEPVEVSFLPLIQGTRIPAGAVLSLSLTIQIPFTHLPTLATPPRIELLESRLQLPVKEDPLADKLPLRAPESGFLSLSLRGDAEEFVNPGEARAFQYTILNEGSNATIVTLSSSVVGDACRTEFHPGNRYRLEAGDSARFGLLVHADSQAKEGAQCHVHVNASSRADPGAEASQRVLVTITRGVDTPDDSGNYTVHAESATKLEQESPREKAPLPPLAAVAALVLAWTIRRRLQA